MARNHKRRIRTVRATLLAVGEGPDDSAFLKYLKSLYCKDNEGVALTVRRAKGGSPHSIIDTAIKEIGAYNKRIALLDNDVEITSDDLREANKHEIVLVISKPVLEGMLLRIHGKNPPSTNHKCKKELKNLFPNGDFTDVPTYQKHFPF